ncbi:arylsulfotransferase family protein [Thermodesulfobacteriota bacterium]
MGWSPFRQTGLTYRDSRSFGGYTLITPIGGKSVYLLDEEGCIVHEWGSPNFQPGYGYLLPNGNLLVRGQPLIETGVGVGEPAGKADILLELDWDSNEIWRWEHETFHHDMARLPNGNTLAIIWELMPEKLAKKIKGGYSPEQMDLITSDKDFMSFILQGVGVGGRPRLKGMLTDALLEVNPAGEPVHIWHAHEHFDPDVDMLCPIDFPFEWTHINSVEMTPEGDVLICSQKLDKIMKISWPKGEVLWKWGGLTRISHPHDPTITQDGTLLVFDNGSKHPPIARSRVIEVDMKTGEIIWQYIPSPVFSMMSMHIAGAERLTNGNTLICEGESGRIFEVNRSCEICWEWVSPFVYNFKGVPVVMLFRAHRYASDSPQLKGRDLKAGKHDELNKKWGILK